MPVAKIEIVPGRIKTRNASRKLQKLVETLGDAYFGIYQKRPAYTTAIGYFTTKSPIAQSSFIKEGWKILLF